MALGLDLAMLAIRWGEVAHLRHGPIPQSRFIKTYLASRSEMGRPVLRWHPVALARISPILQRAVVLAEDDTFYQNDGFDIPAILWAARYDLHAGRIVYGASTITEQTAKNMFLDPARTVFRKANETLLTMVLAHTLTKRRVLAIYLNDAQFGPGIYGAQAAAQYYFHSSARLLTRRQAAELAATLPDPQGGNPQTPDRYFRYRTAKILRLLSENTRYRRRWMQETQAARAKRLL